MQLVGIQDLQSLLEVVEYYIGSTFLSFLLICISDIEIASARIKC